MFHVINGFILYETTQYFIICFRLQKYLSFTQRGRYALIKCSCSDFYRSNFCLHSLCVLLHEKLVDYTLPVVKKRGRGRDDDALILSENEEEIHEDQDQEIWWTRFINIYYILSFIPSCLLVNINLCNRNC